ncbi:MAG: RluA family pseudouridine synthase, partial [Acetatifactor sp.]|nr:RluA family pseudouridine synthase [Acetatifactor sp.]
MQSVTIGNNQAGQRLDKFLHKFMQSAGTGFLYRMLRKKNITLNGKRAEGSEILAMGDTVSFFFSPETFAKMTGEAGDDFSDVGPSVDGINGNHAAGREKAEQYVYAYHALSGSGISVLYED